MKMMRIMVKKAISILAFSELVILLVYFISFNIFINLQVAFLSSFFVIVGSSFAYKKMVQTKLDADMVEEQREYIDTIDDPHELYVEDDINYAPIEELDLKEIVKEEKKKIKTLSVDSIKHGLKGSMSLFRLVPYLFLVVGFIALKNNNLLDISVYLVSILVGIIVGSLSTKDVLSSS